MLLACAKKPYPRQLPGRGSFLKGSADATSLMFWRLSRLIQVNNMVTAKPCQLPSGSGNEPEAAGIEVAIPGLPSQNQWLASVFKIFGAGVHPWNSGEAKTHHLKPLMLFIEGHRERTTLNQERATEHRRWDCFTAIAWNLLVQRDFMPNEDTLVGITLAWWSGNVGSVLNAWAQRLVICFSPLVLMAPLSYRVQGVTTSGKYN